MGSAMLRGWLAHGISPKHFHIVDPVAENLPIGVSVYRSPQEVARRFDIVVLGIKPQMLPSLAPHIAQLLAPDSLVVSILAGTTFETLSAAFPSARVIRLMPNLAAAIGKSPLAVFAPHAGEHADDEVEQLQHDIECGRRGSASVARPHHTHLLARKPTDAERATALDFIGTKPKPENLADLLWSLAMLPEFQLIN